MVPEGLKRSGRQGIHRIAADQFLHVHHVAVGGVLGACARPEQALRPGTLFGEVLPARTRKEPLVAVVGQHRVGNGGLAAQRFGQQGVHRGVDARNEKARDARDPAEVASLCSTALKAGDVALGHLFVHGLRKQQRHVDVHVLADQQLDGRQAFQGGGNLDHQVGARHLSPQPLCLDHRGGRVAREVGGDFEAHVAVVALARVEHRAKLVRRGLDVLDRQRLVKRHRRQAALLEGADGRRVFVAAADRLLEDRGVRGQAGEAVLADQLCQFAVQHEVAADVVQPDRLAECVQFEQGVHTRPSMS